MPRRRTIVALAIPRRIDLFLVEPAVVTHEVLRQGVVDDDDGSSARRQLKNARRIRRLKTWRRFCRNLPRRVILISASALLVITLVRFALGQIDADTTVLVFSTGCVFLAYPFKGHALAEALAEVIRQRHAKPPPT